MNLKDRLTRGLLAGMLAGIPSLAWGLFSKQVLHFSTLMYGDWAIILTIGKKANGLWEILFGQFVVFMFWGVGGIIFVSLIPAVTSKNVVLKGILWGTAVWFISYVITTLFKVQGLMVIPLKTAVSQLIGGIIWGIALAVIVKWLDAKLKIKS